MVVRKSGMESEKSQEEQERIRIRFQPLIEWAREQTCEDLPVFAWDQCRKRVRGAQEVPEREPDPHPDAATDEAVANLYGKPG